MSKKQSTETRVRKLFTNEMLLSFWTHEKCPPDENIGEKKCHFDKNIKHEKCMPCWEAWVEKTFVQTITTIINNIKTKNNEEWIELIKKDGLIKPDDNSVTKFAPFYQVDMSDVEAHLAKGKE